jgi:hypothetical protein
VSLTCTCALDFQCMSKKKLDIVLPLMFFELARVLRPETGRLVLLCGNYISAAKALLQLNTAMDESTASIEDVITMPLFSVFPVNVGGLLAWVVIAQRGKGKARGCSNYKERVRGIACKRDRIEKSRVKELTSRKRAAFQS